MRLYDDLCFIDEICLSICDLPSIRALVEVSPFLLSVPIIPVREKSNNLGSVNGRSIELNFYSHGRGSHNLLLEKAITLSHELRHMFQAFQGCADIFRDSRLNANVEDLLLYDRFAEADATAFSAAIAFEKAVCHGEKGFMEKARERDSLSIDAYTAVARRNEAAHWDGRAATEAFKAYFKPGNFSLLNSYDETVCMKFRKDLKSGRVMLREPVSKIERSILFTSYTQPMADMPVMMGKQVEERDRYKPDISTRDIPLLSRRVHQEIEQIKGALNEAAGETLRAAHNRPRKRGPALDIF